MLYTTDYLQFAIGVLVIFVISCGICNRDKVIEFERRAAIYIKAFFKALYYTIKERASK